MKTIELTEQEWITLLNLIGNNVVWAQAQPLLQKIGQQLAKQGNSQSDTNIFGADHFPNVGRPAS